MGHGTVADEIKGRAPSGPDRAGTVLEIAEEGVRFRSYIDGSERLHGARDLDGGPGRARLRHRARVRRVHAVPRRPRLHRALDRAHAPLARPLPGLARASTGRTGQLVYGIVQGGVYEDLRAESAAGDRRQRRSTASRSAARSAPTRPQMHEVVGWTTARAAARTARATCSGIGDIDDLVRGVELGIDTFDCAMPTRLGRHGMALVPDPERRWRVDLTGGALPAQRRAAHGGLPVPGLRARADAAATCRYLAQGARADRRCACSRCTTSRSSRG